LNLDDRIVDLKKGEDIARKFNKKQNFPKELETNLSKSSI
jgi:hypothetical protein